MAETTPDPMAFSAEPRLITDAERELIRSALLLRDRDMDSRRYQYGRLATGNQRADRVLQTVIRSADDVAHDLWEREINGVDTYTFVMPTSTVRGYADRALASRDRKSRYNR
jgi:hypothetical protein